MKPYFFLLIALLFLGQSCELLEDETEEPETPEQPEYPESMAFVEGGTFTMGCTDPQLSGCPEDQRPAYEVTLKDFYIGRYEVTHTEYDAFCDATGREFADDNGYGRGSRPVIMVSWYDAIAYCNWRSEQEGLTPTYEIDGLNVRVDWNADGYRLPTEAEWEFAARGRSNNHIWAGTSTEARLVEYANIEGEADGYEHTAPVGQFKPNELGLYDMSGNTFEWCWDWYDEGYYFLNSVNGNTDNPKGPSTGGIYPRRVARGGGFSRGTSQARVTYRGKDTPEYPGMGFRLARN